MMTNLTSKVGSDKVLFIALFTSSYDQRINILHLDFNIPNFVLPRRKTQSLMLGFRPEVNYNVS